VLEAAAGQSKYNRRWSRRSGQKKEKGPLNAALFFVRSRLGYCRFCGTGRSGSPLLGDDSALGGDDSTLGGDDEGGGEEGCVLAGGGSGAREGGGD